MSVTVMGQIWKGYPGRGAALLAMLALADWADDDGRCFPSIAKIAEKLRASESQARRVVHGLIDAGHVKVIGNENGGAPSQTRQYQINLALLRGRENARGSENATPRKNARDGSQKCAETGSENDTLTIIDTSITVSTAREQAHAIQPVPPKIKNRKSRLTLDEFRNACAASGERVIEGWDPIDRYIESSGLPEEFVAICWEVFKEEHCETGRNATRKQADWRSHFLNYVTKGYYRLWYAKPGGAAKPEYILTTAGLQAQATIAARSPPKNAPTG